MLASDSGQIAGTVRSEKKQSALGVQVVVVPDQRDRRDLYRAMGSNANGSFAFRGLPPGRYKLFAFEEIEPNSWRDPAVLRPFEDRGVVISVGSSGSSTIELTSIPPAFR